MPPARSSRSCPSSSRWLHRCLPRGLDLPLGRIGPHERCSEGTARRGGDRRPPRAPRSRSGSVTRSERPDSVINSAPWQSDTIFSTRMVGEVHGSTAKGILSFCHCGIGRKGKEPRRRKIFSISGGAGNQKEEKPREEFRRLLRPSLANGARVSRPFCGVSRHSLKRHDNATTGVFPPFVSPLPPPSKESIPNRPPRSG